MEKKFGTRIRWYQFSATNAMDPTKDHVNGRISYANLDTHNIRTAESINQRLEMPNLLRETREVSL